jgi:hypothetical protein
MHKKRFNQKKILGILKTYHAKKRQVERNITDIQLIKILQYGEFEERSEYEVIITLNGYHIYLSHDLDKIITVTGPDIQATSPKVVSNNIGQKIKSGIHETKKKAEADAEQDMSFDHYMKNNYVHKNNK